MDRFRPLVRPQIAEYFDRMSAKQSKTLSPGQLLEQAIKDRNMSKAELADRARVDEATISRWIGGSFPTKITSKFADVCRTLRIKPGKLMDGELETDESIPEEMTISAEEKVKRLLHDNDIGDSFRKIVDSLFEQSLRNRRTTLP